MWRMLISDVLNVVQKQRVIEYKSGAGTKHKINKQKRYLHVDSP